MWQCFLMFFSMIIWCFFPFIMKNEIWCRDFVRCRVVVGSAWCRAWIFAVGIYSDRKRKKIEICLLYPNLWAENETRTRDPNLGKVVLYQLSYFRKKSMNVLPVSGKRDSNSRPQPWQGCALPTELFPQVCHFVVLKTRLELARLSTLAPETSASTIPPLEPLYQVVLMQLLWIATAKVLHFLELTKLFTSFL